MTLQNRLQFNSTVARNRIRLLQEPMGSILLVILIHLQDDSDLTYDQACSIESFANLLAELVVYDLRLKCAKSPSEKPANNLKKALAEEYKNLVPLTVDGSSYFRGT